MAFSYVLYTGNGTLKDYSFSFPYLDPLHIKVSVNGVDAPYTFLSANTVRITTAPPAGQIIEIKRITVQANAPVDFVDGSVLKEVDLDRLVLYSTYAAQESLDAQQRTIFQKSNGDFTAANRHVSDVADPVLAQDAVTLNYVQTTFSPAMDAKVSAAAASASAASTSASQASTSATTAATQAGAAITSANNAFTNATNAGTSETNALASKNSAATSATNAQNSANAASSSASGAASSASAASTSATNASSSASSASTASGTATTQATNAGNSASSASTSATNAATSATNASGSAATATTQAGNASTSASAASGSATAANASKLAAATSETNAGNSATSATASASAANTSKLAAATSETNAGTSATNAGTSATNAASSAAAALVSKNAAGVSETNAATSATNAGNSASAAAASAASIVDVNLVHKAGTETITGIKTYTADQSFSSMNGGAIGGFRNKVINGQFQINQRAVASVGVAGASTYAMDRWRLSVVGPTMNASISQIAGGLSLEGGPHIAIQSSATKTTLVAGDYVSMGQPIEGINWADLMFGTALAKSVTVSFTAQASVYPTNISVALSNGDSTRSCVIPVTITAAGTYSATFPPCTDGTWNTGGTTGALLSFTVACGSTYSTSSIGTWLAGNFIAHTSTSNLMSTTGRFVGFTDVQLERGTVASKFEIRPLGVEFALCQRYYQAVNAAQGGYTGAGAGMNMQFQLPVVMRATPTVVNSSVQNINCASTAVTASNVTYKIDCVGSSVGGFISTSNATLTAEL